LKLFYGSIEEKAQATREESKVAPPSDAGTVLSCSDLESQTQSEASGNTDLSSDSGTSIDNEICLEGSIVLIDPKHVEAVRDNNIRENGFSRTSSSVDLD